jgi:sterol desaturase/sphingolipid hydroxylase (fatty acid hydroxylase superfamily)
MEFFSRSLEKAEHILGRVIRPLEQFSHRYLLATNRWLLARIDPLSYALEGTLTKKILQVTIYPCIMILTLVVGFALVKNGIHTTYTFGGYVVSLIVLGLLFAPLERLIPFSRKWLNDNDEPTDVILFFGNHAFERYISSPLQLVTITVLIQKISPYVSLDLWPSQWPPVIQVFLLLTIVDFFRYWYHRWEHENEFLWRWHSVHHSSERLYWFNGLRVHPLEPLVQGILWGIPLAFVNAPAEIAFVTGFFKSTNSRFQHTNMDLILGPFDYIFSTPKNHRYHHSKKLSEGNSNYAGDVILWDLIFGTFHMPKGKKPSDDIGLADLPNYPQHWVGLMLAPFRFNRLKSDAQKISAKHETKITNSQEIVSEENAVVNKQT